MVMTLACTHQENPRVTGYTYSSTVQDLPLFSFSLLYDHVTFQLDNTDTNRGRLLVKNTFKKFLVFHLC